MSCEGPLLQVNPHHNPYSPMASLDPRNSHIFRPRASSASGNVLLQVEEVPPEPRSSPSSPTHVQPTSSLTLPLSAAFSRSASLPRGLRGRSAEPNPSLSNSATEQSLRTAMSPRFIRRTATVDTNNMHKEEFEVSCSYQLASTRERERGRGREREREREREQGGEKWSRKSYLCVCVCVCVSWYFVVCMSSLWSYLPLSVCVLLPVIPLSH